MGGTFDRLHKGHETLLAKAFDVGSEVFIGLTTDALAQKGRRRTVLPYPKRLAALKRLLATRGWSGLISPIDQPFGRALEPRYEGIVVSPETYPRSRRINLQRQRQGLRPLRVFTVPFAYGDDGLRITATRVASGDIDGRGRRRKPLRVAAGTNNPLKRAAIQDAFAQAFPKIRSQVRSFDVPTGVPEQPIGKQTLRGARRRATGALAKWPQADYGVGVEAGIVRDPASGQRVDVQYAVVRDGWGVETMAHGGGFAYPPSVLREVLRGKTVSQVLGPHARDPRLGSTTGAIGYLTKGALDRRRLTAHAVVLALTPRLRPDLYEEHP